MQLTFLKGKRAGESRSFNPPGIFIGRGKDNDLQLLEDGISQYHAKILFDNDKWSLYDMNSSNGTKINGKKIDKPVLLKPKDVIYIGNNALRFETEESPAGKYAPSVKMIDNDDECIKIRSPEESKPKPKEPEPEKDSNLDEKKAKKPKQSKNRITEARKARRLWNESIMAKKKRLKIIILIMAVIINAVILVIWLQSQSYIPQAVEILDFFY